MPPRWRVKTESPTAVQRAFRLRFNIQPPTRKSVCRWNHQFEQMGCLCKGKSSGRPGVSEENLRRIQDSFERSPRESTRRAEQRTWNTATNCLACVEVLFTVQAIQPTTGTGSLISSFWITLYINVLMKYHLHQVRQGPSRCIVANICTLQSKTQHVHINGLMKCQLHQGWSGCDVLRCVSPPQYVPNQAVPPPTTHWPSRHPNR